MTSAREKRPGEIDEELEVVKPTAAKLLVDGVGITKIKVQGPVHASPKHFDLWTRDAVGISRATLANHTVELRVDRTASG